MTGKRSFLSMGECMVELAPAGDGLFRMGFAGDTFNTAWYARRLLPGDEWSVGYLSAVGDDQVSTDMLDFLEAGGVGTATVRRIEGTTVGLYMIQLADGERSFSYWRGQSAAKRLADDPGWLDGALAGRDILFFSGITLAILAPEARTRLCDAIARARAKGARVAFDTNLRPRLWRDAEEMRNGLLQGASVADIVLPSFDEETGLFGDMTPDDTILRYREAGAGLVVVKQGGDPCHVWSAEAGSMTLETEAVATVVDSTAAGDSFGAGLVAGLATGMGVEDAVRQAMWLAAQVIQRRGALAPDIFTEGGQP